MPGVLANLMPRTVHVAEQFGANVGDLDDLFPEETIAISRAIERRRAEFMLGRSLARQALSNAGAPAVALPKLCDGSVGWPTGYVGSITHCEGYVAAAVGDARAGHIGIGIDAEPHADLDDGLMSLIASRSEECRCDVLQERDDTVHWRRLLFVAKEAAYKAISREGSGGFAFPEIAVHLDQGRSFVARPPDADPVTGRWDIDGAIVVAVVCRLRAGVAAARDQGARRVTCHPRRTP